MKKLGKLIEELREESEKLHRQFKEKPEKFDELEDRGEEFLPPEVSHLAVDFKNGRFNYEDYFRLSTENRQLFEKYLAEELNVKLNLKKSA